MLNRSVGRTPVASFEIAPNMPREVLEAETEFNRIATLWGELLGDEQDAKETLKRAPAEDLAEASAAIAEGKNVKDLQRRENAARAKLTDLTARKAPTAGALDTAGNALAAAIAAHRDEYLAAQEPAEEAATEQVAHALAELRQGIVDLAAARAAREWLEEFDVGRATVGQQQQFFRGQVFVNTTSVQRESREPVAAVLAVLEQVVDPPADPKPRTHRVAVG